MTINIEQLTEKAKQTAAALEAINSQLSEYSRDFKYSVIYRLPDGDHKVRILYDKNNELVIPQYASHRIPSSKKVVCTNHSWNDDNCPICRRIRNIEKFNEDLANDPKTAKASPFTIDYSRYGRVTGSKFFIYLIDTTAPQNDYWKPGNFYVVMSSKTVGTAVLNGVKPVLDAAISRHSKGASEGEILDVLSTFMFSRDNTPIFSITHRGGSGGHTNVIPNTYVSLSLNLASKITEDELPVLQKSGVNLIDNIKEQHDTALEILNKEFADYFTRLKSSYNDVPQTELNPMNNHSANILPEDAQSTQSGSPQSSSSAASTSVQQVEPSVTPTNVSVPQQEDQKKSLPECFGNKFDLTTKNCVECDKNIMVKCAVKNLGS